MPYVTFANGKTYWLDSSWKQATFPNGETYWLDSSWKQATFPNGETYWLDSSWKQATFPNGETYWLDSSWDQATFPRPPLLLDENLFILPFEKKEKKRWTDAPSPKKIFGRSGQKALPERRRNTRYMRNKA